MSDIKFRGWDDIDMKDEQKKACRYYWKQGFYGGICLVVAIEISAGIIIGFIWWWLI